MFQIDVQITRALSTLFKNKSTLLQIAPQSESNTNSFESYECRKKEGKELICTPNIYTRDSLVNQWTMASTLFIESIIDKLQIVTKKNVENSKVFSFLTMMNGSHSK